MPTRTIEQVTKGILNIPKGDSSTLYLLFEVDNKVLTTVRNIDRIYRLYNLSFYRHITMFGWHWFSFRKLPKEEYNDILKNELKKYNPDCPLTTLRVKTNKWIEEKTVWKEGYFDFTYAKGNEIAELKEFKRMLDNQFLALMSMKYRTVMYPFDEKKEKERAKLV